MKNTILFLLYLLSSLTFAQTVKTIDSKEAHQKIKELDALIIQQPKNYELYYNRAIYKKNIRDTNGAIADYQQYVKEGKSLLFLEESKKALKALGAK